MLTETFRLYEDREDVRLKSYIIEDSVDITGNQPRPAVIINPGGGYMYLSKREAEPIALRFASMGYHAFVLEYSTYNKGGALPDLTKELKKQVDTAFPAPMVEIAKAMGIIHENADKWAVDTNKIGLCGFSAGGHNVASYGTLWNNSIVTDKVDVSKDKLKPAFLILGYPLIDSTVQSDHPMIKNLKIATFGTSTPSKELEELYSPFLNVGEHTPPTFIWGTASDQVLSITDSLKFANALAENNRPFELHIFEKGPHGLATADPASARTPEQISKPVSTWFLHVQRWLDDRFALDLSGNDKGQSLF